MARQPRPAQRGLALAGFDVLIAADGEQGVAMAAAKSDLIIMDMELPSLA